MNIRILVANPGSTSTKIAVYEAAERNAGGGNLREAFAETLRHDAEKLQSMGTITDQLGFRKQVVMNSLEENGYKLGEFAAIACRGGLVRQLPSGTYRVNDALIQDSRIGVSGQHASNLGALIGSSHQHHALSWKLSVPVHPGELTIDLTLDRHGGPALTDGPAWLLREESTEHRT